jgi:hypothetical protein
MCEEKVLVIIKGAIPFQLRIMVLCGTFMITVVPVLTHKPNVNVCPMKTS